MSQSLTSRALPQSPAVRRAAEGSARDPGPPAAANGPPSIRFRLADEEDDARGAPARRHAPRESEMPVHLL